MPGPVRPGRSSRAVRTVWTLAVSAVLATLAAAGTPGGASEDPASVPEAAAATEPSPTATPTADPLAAPASTGTPTPTPAPTGTPTPAPAATPAPATKKVETLATAGVRARRITGTTKDWASFTLVDRTTGRTVGDTRSTQVTFTESTVKAWLAADLLQTRAAQGTRPTAYELTRMTSMIRASDDNAAEVIWRWMGADASIVKMIKLCGLRDTAVYHDWWSKTQISARDLAKVGDCIVPGQGKLLSASVGAPLTRLMRSVDASNAFGIQEAAPAGRNVRIAVKNGWTEHGASGQWNVNCLGIWGPGSRWVLAVTIRYPIANGLGYGAAVCRRVTAALYPLVKTG